MKKIGLIGYGWLGSRISTVISKNYKIYTTTTSPGKLQEIISKGIHAELAVFGEGQEEFTDPWSVVPDLDVIIITVPFSEKRSSRPELQDKFSKLFSFIGRFEKQIFFMSSTSIYPDVPGIFTEEMLRPEDVFVENHIKKGFPQVNILRLGGLMGDERLLKNFKVSDLSGVVNHIHYKDIAEVILKMIEKNVHGKVYNVVAPFHPSKREVIAAQNKQLIDKVHDNNKQRIISSEKLISELDYTFIYADPKKFHL
jgi:phage-related protein